MSVMHDNHDLREASTASLAAVAGLLVAGALAFTAMTASVTQLLGAGGGAVPAAFHGLAAFLYLFVGTIGLYLGWRLVTGRIRAFAELQLLATVSAAFSLIAIMFGNWLYIFFSRALIVFLVGVGIATTWIWPPVFNGVAKLVTGH
jgi:hypothetical protein